MYNKSCDLPVTTKRQTEDIWKKIFTGNSLAHTKWNCKYHIFQSLDLCEDAFFIKELITLENYLRNKYLKIEEDAEITDIYVAVETKNTS